MPVESAADRASFVNVDEFAVQAQYSVGGGSFTIVGIFDSPTIGSDLNDVMTIDARPTFWCQESDLPGAAQGDAGDQLTVVGKGAFSVATIEPDGSGMVLLRLAALT